MFREGCYEADWDSWDSGLISHTARASSDSWTDLRVQSDCSITVHNVVSLMCSIALRDYVRSQNLGQGIT